MSQDKPPSVAQVAEAIAYVESLDLAATVKRADKIFVDQPAALGAIVQVHSLDVDYPTQEHAFHVLFVLYESFTRHCRIFRVSLTRWFSPFSMKTWRGFNATTASHRRRRHDCNGSRVDGILRRRLKGPTHRQAMGDTAPPFVAVELILVVHRIVTIIGQAPRTRHLQAGAHLAKCLFPAAYYVQPAASAHVSRPPTRNTRPRFLRLAARYAVGTLGPWFIALAMLILRATCRARIHNDPRAALRSNAGRYIFSVLHAHQIAAAACRERGTAAMVSQSRDGDFVAVGLRLLGVKTIRGSSRRRGEDKGGLSALSSLAEHVHSGRPAYLAVDGPRGPRNRVHKGIAVLSQQTGAAVLNVVAVPTRRWIFERSWDRFQIPKPFCRIDIYAAAPIWPQKGEPVEQYRRRIEQSLLQLESLRDPAEAGHLEAQQEYCPSASSAA